MNIGLFNARKPSLSFRTAALAVGLLLTTSATNAMTLAESTFDPGMELDGWTGFECSNPGLCPLITVTEGPLSIGHSVADPQPFETGDGHLTIIDPSGGSTGLYNAPGEFTSVIAPGTVLEMDFKVIGTSYDNAGTGLVPLFYLDNGSGVGALYAVDETDIPVNTWLEFNVPIVENGDPMAGSGTWFGFTPTALDFGTPDDGTGFAAAFAGGDPILRIFGELTIDRPEADGTLLDNVRITVVPIPAALPMMISALAAFGLWRRKTA